MATGTCTAEEIQAIERSAAEQIANAVRFAEASPRPPESDVLTDVYADSPQEA